ncbi:hypothetical protein R4P65_30560 [Rhodococcus sp. IEGM 1318]|nr:hypothetical protein [Rhodococcus sp. IEGM 1318]MDV8009192.1 hypothetical protein [Rhodococcus sp. IEGM 1318]
MRTSSPNASNTGKTTTTTIDPTAPSQAKHPTNASSRKHETRCHKPLSVAQLVERCQRRPIAHVVAEMGMSRQRAELHQSACPIVANSLLVMVLIEPCRNGLRGLDGGFGSDPSAAHAARIDGVSEAVVSDFTDDAVDAKSARSFDRRQGVVARCPPQLFFAPNSSGDQLLAVLSLPLLVHRVGFHRFQF